MGKSIKCSILMIFAIITVMFGLMTTGVFAEEIDHIAPDINSIKVVQKIVHPGEYVDVIMDITEDGSGVHQIELSFMGKVAEGQTPYDAAEFWGAMRWPVSSNVETYKILPDGTEQRYSDKLIFTGKYRFHIPVNTSYAAACLSTDRWARVLVSDYATHNEDDSFVLGNYCTMTSHVGSYEMYTGNQTYTKVKSELNPADVEGTPFSSSELTDMAVPEFRVEGYDFVETTSSSTLTESISHMRSGDVGFVEVDGDAVLSEEALEALKGKDAEIICQSTDYSWTFNGNDITKETKDVDLSLSTNSVEGGDISSRADLIALNFADNGELPGKAKVMFKSEDLGNYTGDIKDLALYYVDGDDYQLMPSKVISETVGNETWYGVEVTHNSKYYISAKGVSVKGYNATYTYNGKAKKPTVTVTAGGKTLKAGTHYSVSYGKNTNVGKGTIKIIGKGQYSGSKTVTFKINPKGTSIASVSAGKKSLTAKWKKQTVQTTGYQVQCSLKKSMTSPKNATASKLTVKKTFSKLKSGKTYWVRVRTYKTVSGVKYYSSWSSSKSVKTR